jgi:Ig domain of plant-specific actin-binding protein
VAVIAANAAGPSAPATSAPTAVVAASAQAPVAIAAPTISGSATVGKVLTASTGSWSNEPTTYKYKWKRCNSAGSSCTAISGATSSAYAVVSADVGATLRVAVIASNAAGPSQDATSAPNEVVTAASGTQHLE